MKRALILMILILVPFVYADSILDAKRASLEEKADLFIVKMEAAIEFATEKELDVVKLEEIKTSFESKKEESLEGELKIQEMRDLAQEFRDETKEILSEFKEEVQEAVKKKVSENESLKGKIDAALEKRTIAVKEALSARIVKLKDYLLSKGEAGIESKAHEILLERFEEEKKQLNSTDFKPSEFFSKASSLTGSVVSGLKDITGSVIEIVKELDE